MTEEVILIFDIGKTNKKCLVFDNALQVVHEESTSMNELIDENGFPCDDIKAISEWMHQVAFDIIQSDQFYVKAINFSGYGASFVHLDKNGEIILPLYNYLKSFPKETEKLLEERYGTIKQLSQTCASPYLGMLNSGFQLFWLNNFRKKKYEEVVLSLHLPQYLSYSFSKKQVSEYTSIGCHTMLWDFFKNDYHKWVYEEELNEKLAPVKNTDHVTEREIHGKSVKIGSGIHDSSAALLPYLFMTEEPFLLLSTGTWTITLNPFEKGQLTEEELNDDCLMFMGTDGRKVKAARLFLGNEHSTQVKSLTGNFGMSEDEYKSVQYQPEITQELKNNYKKYFSFELGGGEATSSWESFGSFKIAYHQLILELSLLQAKAIKRAKGETNIRTIYVDGGFVDNDIFINILKDTLPDMEVIPAQFPVGSALGAAMMVASQDQIEQWKNHSAYLKQTV